MKITSESLVSLLQVEVEGEPLWKFLRRIAIGSALLLLAAWAVISMIILDAGDSL
jgi:hypothetical protein